MYLILTAATDGHDTHYTGTSYVVAIQSLQNYDYNSVILFLMWVYVYLPKFVLPNVFHLAICQCLSPPPRLPSIQ